MIRTLNHNDVKQVLDIYIDFINEEGTFHNVHIELDKLLDVLFGCADADNKFRHGVVCEKDGEIVGVILFYVSTYYFNYEKISCDYLVYIKPEHRALAVFTGLVRAYEKKAQECGVKEENIKLGHSSGIKTEKMKRLYEHHGYGSVGYLFRKEVA